MDEDMALLAEKAPAIKTTICSDETESRWDAFVSHCARATVFHRLGWKRIFERVYGNECFYLMAEQDGSTVGILPLVFKNSRIFGRFLISLPYFDHVGVCCESAAARKALLTRAQDLARERNAEYIELRHDQQDGLYLPAKQSKVTMTLDLPTSSEKLWSSLKAKVRNQVRKAEKEGLATTDGGAELLDRFFDVYATNMRDLGSPSHRKNFFKKICETFPSEAHIFCVNLNGATIASGFTIASKDTLTIPWASSLRKYSTRCPNMLLYWNILKHACESGFARFSFGRSTPDEGTYQFKKQWGAEPKQLYWQYWLSNGNSIPELNMDNPKYSLAIKIWKSMPVAITKTLGPIVIRNLS